MMVIEVVVVMVVNIIIIVVVVVVGGGGAWGDMAYYVVCRVEVIANVVIVFKMELFGLLRGEFDG